MASLIPYDYCRADCQSINNETFVLQCNATASRNNATNATITFSATFTPSPSFANFTVLPVPTIIPVPANPCTPEGSIPATCLPPGLQDGANDLPPNIQCCCGLPPLSKLLCEREKLEADGRFANISTCLSGGQPYAVSDFPVCPVGFICPNLNVTNNNTWPQICAPTIECQLGRLGGVWCERQGLYEPEICPPGFFCPDGATLVECPENHWCVRGSTAPTPCPLMSLCPPGTSVGRFYGGVLLSGLFDAAIVTLFLLGKFLWGPARLRAGLKRRREALLGATALFSGMGGGGSTTTTSSGGGGGGGSKGSGGGGGRQGSTTSADPNSTVISLNPLRGGRSSGGGGGGGMMPTLELPDSPSTLSGPADWKPSGKSLLDKALPSSPSSGKGGGGISGGGTPPLDALEDAAAAAAAAATLTTSFKMCNRGLSLSIDFSRLSLHIPAPVNKTILSSVSGSILPGRVTAIMGPSGAGKTTFLSVLLGNKVRRTGGTLSINGRPGELSQYGLVIGFVPQEDVMLRELTVRENILHSARVRLPRAEWGPKRVYRLVDAVIEVLGLQSCADTPTDRISGGQRKRTNIGMELATAPAAIFLDEPTSGLDSTAALQVCNTLRTIANLGMTVVAVVHQPRCEIFRSFDDLLLLAPGGKTVYAGPQATVEGYFESLGLRFGGASGNPADDILDFIAGEREMHVTQESVASARKGASMESEAEEAAERQARLSPVNPSLSSSSSYRSRQGSFASSPTTPSRSTTTSSSTTTTATATATETSSWSPPPPGKTTLPDFFPTTPSTSLPGMPTFDGQGGAGVGEGGGEEGNSTSAAIAATTALRTLKGKEIPAYLADQWMCSSLYKASQERLLNSSNGNSSGGGGSDGGEGSLDNASVREALQDRGATLWRQFMLCLFRTLMQQTRRMSWLALEMGVSVFAGGVMGLAATAVDELFSSILAPPMSPISPAPNVSLLPSLGFYIAMAAGIAGSPAAVRTFGEERDVYLRELAGHHSPFSYFMGKVVGEFPRLTLAALHFSAFFSFLALPTSPFSGLFAMVWGLFFGVYGLATLTSMLVDRANGALLGTIASLIMACLCGYGPNLLQGKEWGIFVLQDLSYTRYANELWVHLEVESYREVFVAENIPAGSFGFTLDRPIYDIVMMVALGLAMRAMAYLCLVMVVGDGDLGINGVLKWCRGGK